ncbi:MAG: MCP four helix bundle domain-containing protein [Lachnospiraceae bacterium]|nr:MCP four helix bundle domain-containing protein [Lachnospiraceae bacterium]MBQ8632964.1 MCP four helix bundle domain-containing protein [Lachnospiraceae bacterium]
MLKKMMKMRIQKRLLNSSIMTSAITMVAAVLALVVIIYSSAKYSHVLTYYAFPQGDIGHAMTALSEMQSSTRAAIGYEMQALIDRMVKEHDESKEELKAYIEVIRETIVTEAGQKNMERIDTYINDYFKYDEKVIELGTSGDEVKRKEAQALAVGDMEREYERAYKALEELMATNIKLGDETQAQLNTTTNILVAAVIVFIIVSGIIATKLSQKITKSITDPIDQLVLRMGTFAEGDISSPFPEHNVDDEIADMLKAVGATTTKLQKIFADLEQLLEKMADGNFNITTSCEEEYIGEYQGLLLAIRQMNRQMDGTLKNVREAARAVSAGATNLAEASQSLAEGATDQAASVEEMQATIDEITTALERTAGEVYDSFEKAEACADEAEKSRYEMESMMEAMNRISEASEKIGNIIAELEDIASQTNLLSLNASIEAARAGEAGRGFAVVADEIRKLAEQSSNSAINSRALIEQSIQEVNNGNEAALKTSEVLGNVVSAIHEIAATSKQISEASKHQAQAMEQADLGIERISEVVQANSATAEEASATSEELSAEAISMEELVNQFSLRE